MNNPIYEIYLKNIDKILIFCKEQDYTNTVTRQSIFTDIYIYGDDTLIEVINKIKINLIKHIPLYKSVKFENIAGFLSTDYHFYDNYTLKQYIQLNILNNNNDKDIFINKLAFIDKKYNNEQNLDEKIVYNNIDLENIESINNELVIGYFDRNTINNYTYNISPEKLNRMIENNILIENELNRPINHYVNYDTDLNKKLITQFNFTVVNNENFKKFNYITTPIHLEKTLNNFEFLENIYTSNNNNRLKLNKSVDNLNNIMFKNINSLSLDIYGDKTYDIFNFYNSIKLNEQCPLCILSHKDKKKKITYKMYKKNNIPYIKQDVLENMLDKKKFIESRNYVLYKIFFEKNNIKTNYLIDIYIIEDSYFFINFDFINNNINNVNLNDIITNINNILNILNLTIADKKKLNTIDEFNYFNNKGIIKINNDNDYISSSFNLILNYDELKLPIPKNNIHKFINFLSIFSCFFDIYIEQLSVIYDNKLYNVEEINDEHIKLKRKKIPIPIYDACTITVKTSNIILYYKKSFNYDSFNYLSKFFKNISTFNLKDLTFNYKCIFTTEKTQASFIEYLYYNNYEKYSDIYKSIIPNINFVLDNTPYKDKNYCEHIKRKNNQKTNLHINIDSDIFYMNLKNIDNLNELNNLINTFNYYLDFVNNYDITSPNRLEFDQNIFINKNDTIFNKYNNIYNVYNTINKSSNNEYYLYLLYNSIYKNTYIEDKSDVSDYDLSASDSDSEDEEDEEIEQVIIDDTSKLFEITIDDNIEKFNNINSYKSQFYNADKKDTMKLIFGEAFKSCNLERRPSILPSDLVNRILDKEDDDKIIINKVKSKIFTELFDFNNNIYNITISDKINSDKTSFKMYMGRNYEFHINYTNDLKSKLVLLFNENNNYYDDDGLLNTDTIIKTDYDNMVNANTYLEIYLKNNTKINYGTYLTDYENKNYYFKLNFPQNSINNMYNNYVIGLYNIETNTISKIIKIDLHKPYNYYYDKYLYGDYYFIYLPGKSENTQKSQLHPFHINNMICCYSGSPHINLDLSNNNKKKPHNDIVSYTKEEDLKLDNYIVNTIPKEIYENIKYFLNLPENTEYYKINKGIQVFQAYRFGLTYNSNINNLMFCIFNILKLSNIKLNAKIKSIFKFDILDSNNIKKGLIKCINDIEILNKTALLKLNNNIYAKNTKAKALEKIVNVFSKKTTGSLKTKGTNVHYNEIRKGLSDYVENNFTNLDVNFIWNLCSLIFNINIIIFELTYTNVLSSSVKCPLVNNYNIYDFNNRDTCFILNFDNLYQPITIPTLASSSTFKYNLLFNFRNKDSIINLNNLFNKCLLRYNNNDYNKLLINSVYHKLDFSKNIVIDTKELYDLKDYIKFIVINTDYIKLGIIFEINNSKTNIKEHLFIPINYIKHNINYNIIEKDYKYIYKSKTETDEDFIHDFTKTNRLIKNFYKLHNNSKLNLNNKYITDGKYIIGIGLNIGDYIPVIPYDITEDEEDDDEFGEDLVLADISYLNHNIHTQDTKEELYNKFEYTDLYYQQFISSINSKLIENKEQLLGLIDIDDNNGLKEFINNLIYDLFSFKEFMYLHNKKPSHKIEHSFKICNKLETDIDCDNNCELIDSNCKYIITKEYYELFLGFITNDLIHNHYKRNIILSKSTNIMLDKLNNETHIILDYDDVDKYVINDLYNKILTDKEYYLTGENYSNESVNTSNKDIDNNNYCRNMTYNQTLNISYYEFKPLSKVNIISYSNCIYYNLGKNHTVFKNNYINNVRNSIGNKLKELLTDKTFNLFDIINYYISKNSSHLYTNINDINDLFNIITSNHHWITELDLYLFSLINEKKILFYKDNLEDDDSSNKSEKYYMVMNEKFKDVIKIYVKSLYYKNIYYLIEK